MEIKIISNKNEWNGFLSACAGNIPFAQSWEWGDILIKEGKDIARIAFAENGNVFCLAQMVFVSLPFGWKYAFCPKGPLFVPGIMNYELKIAKLFFDYFKNKNIIFLRIEPRENNLIYNPDNLIRRSMDINPRATLILDLLKSEEELFAKMHPKTRYNIRLAERKNLLVKEEKKFDLFWNLMNETAKRDGFKLHNEKHYREVLNSDIARQLTIFTPDIDKPIATAVFVGFGDTFTYLYGASSYKYRNMMAPHLLQWEGIKIGKELGYKFYDFFGVAPKININRKRQTQMMDSRFRGNDSEGYFCNCFCHSRESGNPSTRLTQNINNKDEQVYNYNSKHQYAGVTRFKLGFGGEYKEDAGTYDLIVELERYRIYRLLRFLRRFI
ncbi:MAG: peptidoglycan bridge formation glycyltransferase FemA/FemB family protein [Patescibacteria group bacterium]|nr:peptidoglycan bridge formation glycyltransferase FemA/FemB family protein [Patescibacteria group bacterium]